MGVTRRIEHLRPINVQDEINDVIDRFNYADFDFSDSDNEAVGAEKNDDSSDLGRLSRSRKNKERRAERKMRRFLDVENHGVVTKSRMGARKQRQYENARIVMSFADQDDICTDFTDLVPHTVTAFDRLFLDQESMQMWNDFVERDEEEQRQILDHAGAVGSGCGWFVVSGKKPESCSVMSPCLDGRKHHPAYCAKACFNRMDRRNKRLLFEKRLPWDFINRLEEDLISFFSSLSPTTPSKDDAVYVGAFGSSFERAIGHAVAQFLMLKSKSVTVQGSGDRLTEFRNPRAFFIPPYSRLLTFLSSLRPIPDEVLSFDKWKDEEAPEEEDDSQNSSFCEVEHPDASTS
ncbi:hypothetical protein Q1695_012882 [Nippostrongylus brasiliensis]|nr:hypothetical protein Q1695_012882 [Nippostrongylus brasiliensis]